MAKPSRNESLSSLVIIQGNNKLHTANMNENYRETWDNDY